MLELVTHDEAVAHLRLDETADDPWLSIFIPAISAAVAGWLKDEWRLYVPEMDNGDVVVDSSGDPVPLQDSSGFVVNPLVKAAVLLELGSAYRYREGEGDNDMPQGGRSINGQGHGYSLCRGATNMLASLRKPTLA